MARGVFFSFHYNDVSDFRVNVVRNSRALRNAGNPTTFIDRSLWEESENKSPEALKKLINQGLNGCGVTAALIGNETAKRRWVKFEIVKSFTEGKGVIPIHINRIRTRTTKKITKKGTNPLTRLKLKVDDECQKIYFYELKNRKWFKYRDLPFVNNRQKNFFLFTDGGFWRRSECGAEYEFTDLFQDEYCWIRDDGYNNFPDWVEEAANKVGR